MPGEEDLSPFSLACLDRMRAGRYARAGAISLGVSLADALRATPAQLAALVFHPRTKEGALKPPVMEAPPPEIEPTKERDLVALEAFRGLLSPEKYEAARAKVEAFWEAKTDG